MKYKIITIIIIILTIVSIFIFLGKNYQKKDYQKIDESNDLKVRQIIFEQKLEVEKNKQTPLKEYQRNKIIEKTEKSIEEKISKLNEILKANNIKLKEEKLSEEEKINYLNKINRLEKDIANIMQ